MDANNNTYQQETDLQIIQLILPYINNKTFLDIGAEKGTFTKFLASQSFSGTIFEPLPKFKANLQTLATELNCSFFDYAIDDIDRTAAFFQAFDHDGNSVDYFSSLNPLENDTRIKHKEVCTVSCRSLNSLADEGIIEKIYGLIKTDTEGNDLNVLKGMTNLSADALICEYFMPGIYTGWENGNPYGIIEAAYDLGYNHFVAIKRFNDFELVSIDINSFSDKQWGNIIFLKDALYHRIKIELFNFVKRAEVKLVQAIENQYNRLYHEIELLRNVCDQRKNLIDNLTIECEKRQEIIDSTQKKWRA